MRHVGPHRPELRGALRCGHRTPSSRWSARGATSGAMGPMCQMISSEIPRSPNLSDLLNHSRFAFKNSIRWRRRRRGRPPRASRCTRSWRMRTSQASFVTFSACSDAGKTFLSGSRLSCSAVRALRQNALHLLLVLLRRIAMESQGKTKDQIEYVATTRYGHPSCISDPAPDQEDPLSSCVQVSRP